MLFPVLVINIVGIGVVGWIVYEGTNQLIGGYGMNKQRREDAQRIATHLNGLLDGMELSKRTEYRRDSARARLARVEEILTEMHDGPNDHDGQPVHTGDTIRNGAIVLLSKDVRRGEGTRDAQIVLCLHPSKREFIVWYRAFIEGECRAGEHFGTANFAEDLDSAIKCFENRS